MQNNFSLKKYAVNYISKYNSSKSNLEKILKNKIRRINLEKKEKFILYNSIGSILKELELKNIINDETYSESKIYNFYIQGKSKYFIKNYLINKGIKKELFDEVLKNFENNYPDWEIESAKTFARKKRLGTLENCNLDNKKKDLAKMARAGFNYDIIKNILEIN